MRATAAAVSNRVVRIFDVAESIGSAATWACVCTSSVGFPAEVIGHRRTPSFDEVVFGASLTPGATYELRTVGEDVEVLAVFSGYEPDPAYQGRLNLWRCLPEINRRQDIAGDLLRFVGCLQDNVDLLVMRVAQMTKEFDSRTCSTAGLHRMLTDQGNPFAFALPGEDGRRLSGVLTELYRQKGSARGIVNAIRLFLGIEVTNVRCHGVTRDDDGIIVGGADRSSIYAFDLEFSAPLSREQKQRVRGIAEYLKPAHTHLVDVLAPASPGS